MIAPSKPGASHGGITLPWRTLLLGAGAIVAYLILGAAPEAWVFDRVAIVQGEWWRLITGHWMHSDLMHAVWDIAALLLLGTLFEARLHWRLPLALLVATVGVDAWLWWGDPALQYYCGLSGILNSLLIVGVSSLRKLYFIDLKHGSDYNKDDENNKDYIDERGQIDYRLFKGFSLKSGLFAHRLDIHFSVLQLNRREHLVEKILHVRGVVADLIF